MWALALPRGARVAVDPAQWYDAFAVVTRGRVQLELRDGEPGPVLGRDAGFWLRGTGVRALRNPAVARRGCASSRPGPGPSHASQHTPYASYRMMEEVS